MRGLIGLSGQSQWSADDPPKPNKVWALFPSPMSICQTTSVIACSLDFAYYETTPEFDRSSDLESSPPRRPVVTSGLVPITLTLRLTGQLKGSYSWLCSDQRNRRASKDEGGNISYAVNGKTGADGTTGKESEGNESVPVAPVVVQEKDLVSVIICHEVLFSNGQCLI